MALWHLLTMLRRLWCIVAMQAIAQFCLLAVVGMLLGIACGMCTSWLLEHIFRCGGAVCVFSWSLLLHC